MLKGPIDLPKGPIKMPKGPIEMQKGPIEMPKGPIEMPKGPPPCKRVFCQRVLPKGVTSFDFDLLLFIYSGESTNN